MERELQQANSRHAKQLKELKEEFTQAIKDKDYEVAEMLRQSAEKRDEALTKAKKDHESLRINCEQLLAGSEKRSTWLMQQLKHQLQQKERDFENMEQHLAQERKANEDRHR